MSVDNDDVATEGLEQEICPICREVFNDPVVCRDGYAYCRLCIGMWIDTRSSSWRSPMTNQFLTMPALLVPDRRRAGVAREQLRQTLRDSYVLTGTDIVQIATARFGLSALFEAQDCRLALESLLQDTSAIGETFFPHIALELAWRSRRLDDYPLDAVEELCRHEREESSWPLIQRGVLHELALSVAKRFVNQPAQRTARIASLLLNHCTWRGSITDGVLVPAHRLVGQGLHSSATVFERPLFSAAQQNVTVQGESFSAMTFTGPGNARLHLGMQPEEFSCSTEACVTAIEMPRYSSNDPEHVTGTSSRLYTSLRPTTVSAQSQWKYRRREHTVFPDNSDDSDPEEPVAGENGDQEEEETGATDDASTTASSNESVIHISDDDVGDLKTKLFELDIMERAIQALPFDFRWVRHSMRSPSPLELNEVKDLLLLGYENLPRKRRRRGSEYDHLCSD